MRITMTPIPVIIRENSRPIIRITSTVRTPSKTGSGMFIVAGSGENSNMF